MELVKDNKQESNVTSIHNSNKQQENKEFQCETMKVFMSDIYPAMTKKEKYKVFYGNPSTDELQKIMERVVERADIRKEIILEKLS
ncbi:hypothetical protein [Priestia aryabhattai]|uniref:hypothetical protein n=1 Tax=Priestia aryabhattai TaxID=412384 RepID=UPI0015F5FBA2|nr:hypothetical protein [Priestia aryabhattai]